MSTYIEVMRIERPACECPPRPAMELPGFCTNCGSWFDRASVRLHCAERQQPPSWTAIQEQLDHHLWFELTKWDDMAQQIAGSVLDSDGCCVYRLWDADGAALYIGMTTRGLIARLWEHRCGKDWWESVNHIDAVRCTDRRDALDEEARQIRSVRPLHNLVHNTGRAA